MLPEKLSNGICSLNPNVDRLTFTCEMVINQKGIVIDYKIYESVIHSKARLTKATF
jgi:ribonuclease R